MVDFGHAKEIFPDADVFPCILVAQKPDSRPVPASTRVCVIPREQLAIEDLAQQINRMGSSVERTKLGAAGWSLEPAEVDALLEKLKTVGRPLREYANTRPLFGIKTGFNEAFLIDGPTKNAIVSQHSESRKLLRPYLRGQDIGRWHADWDGLWMIAVASSGDHAWPWADAGDQAEEVFRQTYPAVHEHLLKFKDQLVRRQDQGRYWWELRACAYWDKFDQPKLLYQDITWSPQVCLDTDNTLINNTVYLLPTNDTWLMAVLNSPLGWWYAWRKAQHGKDEALRFYGDFVESFPIAPPNAADIESTNHVVSLLVSLAKLRRDKTREFLDWLLSEMALPKLSQKVQAFWRLGEEELVAEVRKLRGRTNPLSPSSLKSLKDAYSEYAPVVQTNIEESRAYEQAVSDAVCRAFTMTPEEVALMWKTAPPRTPGPSALT